MKIKNYKKVYESNTEIRYEHKETLQGVENYRTQLYVLVCLLE